MRVCLFDELANGSARGVAPPGQRQHTVFVVRHRDRVFAYRDACPHEPGGSPMAWRKDAYLDGAGTRIVCHAHGAQFDIETGVCLLGPCLGQALIRVPVAIDGTGAVVIPTRFLEPFP